MTMLAIPGRTLPREARSVLDSILRAGPSAPNARVRAALLAAIGRVVGDKPIYHARRRLGLPRARGGAKPGAGRPPRLLAPRREFHPGPYPTLHRRHADLLAWIAANRPDLTPLQCVALLAMEMDRT